VEPLQPPDSIHLTAAQGWLELGNHEEAFEELEQIDATLRGHPDVLEVRWGIYASIEKWDYCLEIGSSMVRLDPARFTGWINRSFALHCLKRTKEAEPKARRLAIGVMVRAISCSKSRVNLRLRWTPLSRRLRGKKLSEYVLNYVSVDIGEAEVTALVAIG
jgi:hypothetical protein